MEIITPQSPATKDQIQQIKKHGSNVIETALNEIDLNESCVKNIINNSDKFAAIIHDVVKKTFLDLSLTDKYKDEEIKLPKLTYSSGYKKPRKIKEQVNRLCELIPGIGLANEKITKDQLPKNAEGWFAIPRWQSLAPTYAQAVQMVLYLLMTERGEKLYNHCCFQIANNQLEQTTLSQKIFAGFDEAQKNYNIQIIPAQFGILHQGRSVRRALEIMKDNGQFGLGIFAIGIMLLTHPERLSDEDNTYIDCSGDKFSDPDTSGLLDSIPCFSYSTGGIHLDTFEPNRAFAFAGSASGFISTAVGQNLS